MYSEGFILALVGIGSACLGAFLTFILRSRCTKITCCCCEIQRKVLTPDEIEANVIEVKNTTLQQNNIPK